MPPKKITRGPATTQITDELTAASAEGVKAEVERVVEETIAEGVDPGYTIFVSAREEADTFDLTCGVEENEIVRGVWDRNGERIVFRVPDGMVPRIMRHTFVHQGRVVPMEKPAKPEKVEKQAKVAKAEPATPPEVQPQA